jgi:hypothetical protein
VKKLLAILLGPIIALPVTAGSARAAPARQQRFALSGRVEAPSLTLVAAGVLNGAGSLTAETVEYHPSDRTYLETDRAVIGDGTLTFSIAGAFDTWPFTLDPRTCAQHGGLAGTWRITAAGGAFSGAAGSGTFSGRFLTYARRAPAGCDETAIKGFVAGGMTGTLAFVSAAGSPLGGTAAGPPRGSRPG